MNFKFSIIFGTFLCLNLSQTVENASTPSDEAVIECGNIHHIELQNFPQANASFSNGKCRLTCWIGNTILATDSIYEGRSCPEDSNGTCHNGQCIDGQEEEALRKCGLNHNLDFHKMKDHKGTAFTHDQCMLKCVLDGAELSTNPTHEGSPCPGNLNGVCRSGTCVTQSTNPETTVTIPPTKPSDNSFSLSNMKLLNITLESTNPPLNRDLYIRLFFYKNLSDKAHETYTDICHFYGLANRQNYYHPNIMSELVNKIDIESQLSVDLEDDRYVSHLTEPFKFLNPLFASFYKSHKLAFGEKEDFVAKFEIHRKVAPHDKVMDVAVRFTIVFSKD